MIADYATVRAHLEEMLRERVEQTERIDNRLSEPTNADWEERAVEREDDDTLSSIGNLALHEIDQIKHAIYCIDNGTYGVCSKCGAKIARERLEFLPYATTCADCA